MKQMLQSLFPKGLIVLIIMHLLIIYSIVSVSSTLVFYCETILKYSVTDAGQFFAAAFALLWGLDIIGGYLGSKFSHKQTIIIGSLLLTAGLLILSHGGPQMTLGLAAMIVGFVMAIPNINLCIAHLYDKEDERSRCSGFTLSQLGVNIGSMLAAFITGYVVEMFGYHTAYGVAAIFPVCAVVLFVLFFKSFELKSDSTFLLQSQSSYQLTSTMALLFLAILAWAMIMLVLNHYMIASKVMLSSTLIVAVLIFYAATKGPSANRKNLLLLLLVFCITTIPGIIDSLLPSFFLVFIQAHVNRVVFGHILPATMFQGINAFFIIVLCIPLSIRWIRKSKNDTAYSVFNTLGIGLLLYGISCLIIAAGLYGVDASGNINILWIIVCYFLQALGFLLIKPLTIAMIRKLSPIHLEGIILGAFSFSGGVAGLLSGVAMLYLNLPNIQSSGHQLSQLGLIGAFEKIGLIPFVAAICLLLMTCIYKKKISK